VTALLTVVVQNVLLQGNIPVFAQDKKRQKLIIFVFGSFLSLQCPDYEAA
jgi:uncharacterized protein YhhL (DUF1145 family)